MSLVAEPRARAAHTRQVAGHAREERLRVGTPLSPGRSARATPKSQKRGLPLLETYVAADVGWSMERLGQLLLWATQLFHRTDKTPQSGPETMDDDPIGQGRVGSLLHRTDWNIRDVTKVPRVGLADHSFAFFPHLDYLCGVHVRMSNPYFWQGDSETIG